MHKNFVSGTLLCRDGFKVVLESNKIVVFKSGQFIGKGYDCRGLFCFSLLDFNNKFVNHICANVDDLASICIGILFCVILILVLCLGFTP
jgi:hypothetical protein